MPLTYPKDRVPVDILTIQRSLAILEERYQHLHQSFQHHIGSWESENIQLKQTVASQAEAARQAEAAAAEQANQLQAIQADRDSLLNQLASQAEAAREIEVAAAEQATQLQAIQADRDSLKQERDALASLKEAANQQVAHCRQRLSTQTEVLRRVRQLAVLPPMLQR